MSRRNISWSRMALAVAAMGLAGLFAQQAAAQNATRDFTRSFYANRPTVSPYLNLITQQQTTGFAPIYQNIVRPQIEAREAQLRQDAEITRIQSQLSEIRADFNRYQRQGGPLATGHPTRFMTYLHYYPALQLRR